MANSLWSFPYTPSKNGYWSPQTSTINWCEEGYYASHYVAEIVNTLTNAIFIYLATRGLKNCIKQGHDRVFLVAFVTYLFIGIGSILFHTSQKYSMQLMDELSMVYTASTLFFAAFSFQRSKSIQILIGFAVVFTAIFITLYYHFLKDPTFHQVAFGILCLCSVAKSIYNMETCLRPNQKTHKILKQMWILLGFGVFSVGFGFFLWNLDFIFCSQLRQLRHQLGLPWGIVLELHGWWHIFTGLSMYYNLKWGIWLRYCMKGVHDDVELIWPSYLTSLPDLIVKRKDGKDMKDMKDTKKFI